MKNHVLRKECNQLFYQNLLELSATITNQIVKLSPTNISALRNTADCFGDRYLERIFDDTITNLSGDCYLTRIKNNNDDSLILDCVRGGESPKIGKTMKMDIFAVKVASGDVVSDKMYPCYHLACDERYVDPIFYKQMFLGWPAGEYRDLASPELSGLQLPIQSGLEKINDYIEKEKTKGTDSGIS